MRFSRKWVLSTAADSLQLRKVFFSKLKCRPSAALYVSCLALTQFHATNFSRDSFRQIRKFDSSNAIERCQHLADVSKNRQGDLARRLDTRLKNYECLWQGGSDRIGRWNHRTFDNLGVLDQSAFKFKRANSIVRSLENIVAPANKGKITIRVA